MLTKAQTKLWQRWIRALESGEYRQARGTLRKTDEKRGDSFCCLGVACDIVAKDVKGKWHGEDFSLGDGRSCSGTISDNTVRELFGFTDSSGFEVLDKDGEHRADIAELNDASRSRKGPFSNVLPHIKRYFEKNKFQAKKGNTK